VSSEQRWVHLDAGESGGERREDCLITVDLALRRIEVGKVTCSNASLIRLHPVLTQVQRASATYEVRLFTRTPYRYEKHQMKIYLSFGIDQNQVCV
jgi:hypothetical protein